jgi:hypothetical protein
MASSITNNNNNTDTDDKVIAWFLKRRDDIATLVQKCNNLNNYPPLLHALPLLRIPTNELHLVVPHIRTVRQGFVGLKNEIHAQQLQELERIGIEPAPVTDIFDATSVLLSMRNESSYIPWQLQNNSNYSLSRNHILQVFLKGLRLKHQQLHNHEYEEFLPHIAAGLELQHFTLSTSHDEYINSTCIHNRIHYL